MANKSMQRMRPRLLFHEPDQCLEQEVCAFFQVLPADGFLRGVADAVRAGDENHGDIRFIGENLRVMSCAARKQHIRITKLFAFNLEQVCEPRRDAYGLGLINDL